MSEIESGVREKRPPAMSVASFAALCQRQSPEDFVAAYPHPLLIQVSGLFGQRDHVSSYFTREHLESDSLRVASLMECPVFLVAKREGGRFRDMITVGRARLNDITIHHDKVSKLHSYFHCRDDAWFITDCESSNRTYVGGLELVSNKPVPLSEREEIALSPRVTFLYRGPLAFYEQIKLLGRDADVNPRGS